MLKRFFVQGSHTAPPPPTEPRSYYISTSGTGDGLTSSTPAPLSFLESQIESGYIIAGDQLFFNRGDEFHLSDLSMLNSMDIDAFGSGAKPILSGAHSISALPWTNNGDGTYYTVLADEPLWVWIDRAAARRAESDWYTITAVPSTTERRISAATMAGLSSVVGAKVIFKEFDFRATELFTVTGENDGTGGVIFTPSLATGFAAVGMALKFINQSQFMTTQNDWYYDDSAERLYVKSTTSPASMDIRISVDYDGIILQGDSNVTIQNINFKNYFRNTISIRNCTSVSITNCDFDNGRGSAIRVSSSEVVTINDNTFSDYGLRGIEHAGIDGMDILRNTFNNIGMQDNIGYPYDLNHTGGTAITIMVNPDGVTLSASNNVNVEDNVMTNLGYQAFQQWGSDFTFINNRVDNFGLKWIDGGAVHTIYRTVIASATENGLIQGNYITRGIGNAEGTTHSVFFEGIYVDNGCNNITVDGNTVDEVSDAGILANWDTKNTTITNNNVVGCTNLQVWIRQDTDPADSPVWPNNNGNILTGNILATRSNTARCVNAQSLNNSTTYNPFSNGGNSDSNAYVNPYGVNINSYNQNTTVTNYTLATWRTKMGMDALSTERTNYIAFSSSANALEEVKVEFNDTDSPVNFNVPAGYSDQNGNAFVNPVSIPAHRSLVYFKNTSFP